MRNVLLAGLVLISQAVAACASPLFVLRVNYAGQKKIQIGWEDCCTEGETCCHSDEDPACQEKCPVDLVNGQVSSSDKSTPCCQEFPILQSGLMVLPPGGGKELLPSGGFLYSIWQLNASLSPALCAGAPPDPGGLPAVSLFHLRC
ncbi:MAG: hypothetical protein EXR99_10155 [Gemmataceae bacterium]|nr:hypothetical protein [Gemmataceae bacterium]